MIEKIGQLSLRRQCELLGLNRAGAAAAQLRNIDNPRPAEAADLNTPERFAVLLVDPWRAEAKRICGDRDIITYRRLLPSEQIKKIGKEICKRLPGSLLLVLRAPGELIAEALRLIDSWDFAYRDQLVCRYPGAGINEYVRYEHEVLLLGTRGESVLPDPKNRPGSIIDIDDYTFIEKMWPGCSKFAYLARTEIPGWTPWPDEEGGNSWRTLVGAANPSRRELQDTSEVSLD